MLCLTILTFLSIELGFTNQGFKIDYKFVIDEWNQFTYNPLKTEYFLKKIKSIKYIHWI